MNKLIIPKKAVFYLRYSSAGQTEQSIEGQRDICQNYAESNGYEVIHEYIDRATSASHDTQKRKQFLKMIDDAGKRKFDAVESNGYEVIHEYIDRATSASHDTQKRKQFLKMIDDAGKRKFDAVIVYKLDRFARNRYDSAKYKQKLKVAGVRLISATEAISEGAEGILMESVLEGMAEYYAKELSEKVNRGIDQSIKKRNFLGGPVPFGFKIQDKKMVPDPVNAPLLKAVFQLILEGYSFTEISEYLASKGATGKKGEPFKPSSIGRMAHNKKYIGYYIYKDIEIPDQIEPLIDEETFYRVQEKLKMVEKKRHSKTEYLLAGKLFCGHCGKRMNGEKGRSKNGQYYHYYVCEGRKRGKSCTKQRVKKEYIEDIVVQKAQAMLNDDTIENLVSMIMNEYLSSQREDDQKEEIKERIRELEKQIDNGVSAILSGYLENLVSMIMNEYLSSQREDDQKEEIKERIRELEKQIDNGVSAILSGYLNDDLKKRLDSLSEQKQGLLNRLADLEASEMELTPEKIRYYLYRIKSGSENSQDHRKRLINTFIEKVILWDEGGKGNKKMQIVFRLSNGTQTVESSTSSAYAPPLRSTIFENHTFGNSDIPKVFLYSF